MPRLFTGIEIGMRPPGAGRPNIAVNREAYAFMGFPSVLREADAVASGILGLIGWAYFGATTLYLLLRKQGLAALVAGVALCMCVYAGERRGRVTGRPELL